MIIHCLMECELSKFVVYNRVYKKLPVLRSFPNRFTKTDFQKVSSHQFSVRPRRQQASDLTPASQVKILVIARRTVLRSESRSRRNPSESMKRCTRRCPGECCFVDHNGYVYQVLFLLFCLRCHGKQWIRVFTENSTENSIK